MTLGDKKKLGARFTKQGKLSRERNSKTVPMGGENSACDVLTDHFHNDQWNLQREAQITACFKTSIFVH